MRDCVAISFMVRELHHERGEAISRIWPFVSLVEGQRPIATQFEVSVIDSRVLTLALSRGEERVLIPMIKPTLRWFFARLISLSFSPPVPRPPSRAP
jgi:hypothetical protein